MATKTSKKHNETSPFQFRLSRDDERGRALFEKIQKISEANGGMSLNTVVNLAVGVGLPIVEKNLSELQRKAA